MTVEVKFFETRNDNFVTFETNRQIIPRGTGLSFPDKASAEGNALAKALFGIKGVASVWILGTSVQITKEDSMRWGSIKSRIVETLQDQLEKAA